MIVAESGLRLAAEPTFELSLPHAADPFLSALLCLPPLQVLAYSWTVARGMNPDAPASMQPILAAILPPGRKEPELRGG
jgi:fructoselysine-6-P-deglycase FrlB-like protein